MPYSSAARDRLGWRKDGTTPAVSVIDLPQTAEKKSFPPRLLVILLLTSFCMTVAAVILLIQHQLHQVSPNDPRKLLAYQINTVLRMQLRRWLPYW